MRLCRAQKSRAVDHALIVFYEGLRAKRPIPDFALDRHTGRGRGMKRGWRHFWEEGARLEGCEAPRDPYAQKARPIRRDSQDELPLD
ncbi:MAG TPA: hypothetical protein VFD27_02330 [Chthoniobacteraceae bacterium]|nr:hypothetical protein [Chthoniobacteraceae bacterium]